MLRRLKGMTILINSMGQMEVAADFPSFESHEIAASWGCQCCGGKLNPSAARDYGYPPKRGQYGIKCEKCSGTLFYTLATSAASRGRTD